jgi:aerobic-type carbon monoxide dehydrogenase small subunit (CoxS/CutS family)
VNGETKEIATEVSKTLLEVLREDLALTGTKHGCELGECGTCAVLVDGNPVLSCLMLGIDAEDTEIVTVEGMIEKRPAASAAEKLRRPGGSAVRLLHPRILLTAMALLEKNSHPTRDEIRQALSGNLCRFTGYTKILQAVELTAEEITQFE